MNTDKDLNCVDLVRAVIRIQELCSKRDCNNCIFCKSYNYHFPLCKVNFPYEWETDSLSNWLKEHESEETK